MSIKTVRCPHCGTTLNVPATMASTKCTACDAVFAINAAASGAPSAATASPATKRSDASAGQSKERIGQWLVVGGVAALAVIGLIVITALQFGTDDAESDSPEIPMQEQATVVEDLQLGDEETPEFRVVDLPESTRKKIYLDYSKMIASSFGKAKKIPKGGLAGQALNQMLGSTVDREVKHMALIHGVTEEDIAQIYAEGQAKDW